MMPTDSPQDERGTLIIEDPTLRLGFILTPKEVLFARNLSHPAKSLYGILLHYAWQDGQCFPGYDRLGEDLNLSDNTARMAMRQLEDSGLVRQKRRGMGRTNLYVLCDVRAATLTLHDRHHPLTSKSEVHEPQNAPLTSKSEVHEPAKSEVHEPAKSEVYIKEDKDSELQRLSNVVGAGSANANGARAKRAEGEQRLADRELALRAELGHAAEVDTWVSHLAAARKTGKVAASVVVSDLQELANLAAAGVDWRQCVRLAVAKPDVPIGYLKAIAKRLKNEPADAPQEVTRPTLVPTYIRPEKPLSPAMQRHRDKNRAALDADPLFALLNAR